LFHPTTFEVVAYAEREITYIKRPDVIQVSLERPGLIVSKTDPTPGLREIILTGVTVHYRTFYLHSHTYSNYYVRPSLVFKKDAEAVEAGRTGRFIAYTSFGEFEYSAQRQGNRLFTTLNSVNYRTNTGIPGGGNPYIVFQYEYEGRTKTVIIGDLQIILDPGGWVVDAITEQPIDGATVTLYRKDDLEGNWELWTAHDGQTNPMRTSFDGAFNWDVEDGIYMITVYHPDYNTMEHQYTTENDPEIGIIQIPPERTDIIIRLPKQIIIENRFATTSESGEETEVYDSGDVSKDLDTEIEEDSASDEE
jgi:hypothetical protein